MSALADTTVLGVLLLGCAVAWRGALRAVHRARVHGRVQDRARVHGRVPRGGASGSVRPPRRGRALAGFLERALDDADIGFDPHQVGTALAIGAVAAPVVLVLLGAAGVPAALGAPAAVCGPLAVLRAAGGRADRRLERALPDVLDGAGRALRSGASLVQALEAAAAVASGRLARELGALLASVRAGTPLVAALDDWAARRPLPAVRLTAAALALTEEGGGPRARAVEGVAATLRDRRAAREEARVLATQARLSALVVAAAPLVFVVFAAVADPRIVAFLLGSGPGQAVLVAGIALDVAAGAWMQRLSRVEV